MELRTMLRRIRPQEHAPAPIGVNRIAVEPSTEVLDAVHHAVRAMSVDMAVTVAGQRAVLTTSEAARLLKISRPKLTRLLDAGEIAFEQSAAQRQVRLVDVLAYQEHVRRAHAASLAEMTRASDEDERD